MRLKRHIEDGASLVLRRRVPLAGLPVLLGVLLLSLLLQGPVEFSLLASSSFYFPFVRSTENDNDF